VFFVDRDAMMLAKGVDEGAEASLSELVEGSADQVGPLFLEGRRRRSLVALGDDDDAPAVMEANGIGEDDLFWWLESEGGLLDLLAEIARRLSRREAALIEAWWVTGARAEGATDVVLDTVDAALSVNRGELSDDLFCFSPISPIDDLDVSRLLAITHLIGPALV
jgi:hypothetical protein